MLLAVFEVAPELFRSRWKQQPMISAIDMGSNDQADFLSLTTYSLHVFKTPMPSPIRAILQHSKHQIIQWIHIDGYQFTQAPNGRKPELSVEDRMM